MPTITYSYGQTPDGDKIAAATKASLEKAGITAREAEDGEAALAAVSAQAPDLVVLDINMPKLDGLEVCRRLRAMGDLPILFLSSRDDEIDRVLGIELGGDEEQHREQDDPEPKRRPVSLEEGLQPLDHPPAQAPS